MCLMYVPGSLAGEQWPSTIGFNTGVAGALWSSSPVDMTMGRHPPRDLGAN